ncbi:hypothetical protein T11_14073 [Trichinella zimbabwensis]|uniref:Uncharacterized protein n=1 Tax=Trichinella zimbabwensis TaxID=268475 RepID=A0A0V1I956_9BILA|nr:hypothetical protein T11_14073 [Trichinella zimbabwensis]
MTSIVGKNETLQRWQSSFSGGSNWMLYDAPRSFGHFVSLFSIDDLLYMYFWACVDAIHMASCGSSLLDAIFALVSSCRFVLSSSGDFHFPEAELTIVHMPVRSKPMVSPITRDFLWGPFDPYLSAVFSLLQLASDSFKHCVPIVRQHLCSCQAHRLVVELKRTSPLHLAPKRTSAKKPPSYPSPSKSYISCRSGQCICDGICFTIDVSDFAGEGCNVVQLSDFTWVVNLNFFEAAGVCRKKCKGPPMSLNLLDPLLE